MVSTVNRSQSNRTPLGVPNKVADECDTILIFSVTMRNAQLINTIIINTQFSPHVLCLNQLKNGPNIWRNSALSEGSNGL